MKRPVLLASKILLPNGIEEMKRLEKGCLLGRGAYAECFEMKDVDTGKIFACKIFAKENGTDCIEKMRKEIELHKKTIHFNIVKYEGYFEDSLNCYLLLEFCPNKTLREMVEARKKEKGLALTEVEARYYTAQLVDALRVLRNANIIHRDIKPSNVFLGRAIEAKLGDFGLAIQLSSPRERRKTICGTPNYISPEMLTSNSGYSFETDIWSLGIIVYTMLFGTQPFYSKRSREIYRKISKNDYLIPDSPNISNEAKSFIQAVLEPDPSKRLDLDGIMKHDFMSKFQIPRKLPMCSLDCCPEAAFIKMYSSSSLLIKLKKSIKESQIMIQTKGFPTHHINPSLSYSPTPRNRHIILKKTDSQINLPLESNSRTEIRQSIARSIPRENTHSLLNLKSADVSPNNAQRKQSFSISSLQKPNPRQISALVMKQGTFRISTAVTPRIYSAIPLYLRSYVDWTGKYGIGYTLTNDLLGFYFNDKSNLQLIHLSVRYAYYEPNSTEPFYLSEESAKSKDLQKKIKIINYYYGLKKRAPSSEVGITNNKFFTNNLTNPVYIKLFAKLKKGVVFLLTNEVVQTFFLDKTQIIFNEKSSSIVYIDPKGSQINISANTPLAAMDEIIRSRFLYSKKVIEAFNKVV